MKADMKVVCGEPGTGKSTALINKALKLVTTQVKDIPLPLKMVMDQLALNGFNSVKQEV